VPSGLEAPILATLEAAASGADRAERRVADPLGPEAEVYEALKLGLRDYVTKNGFQHVVLALSGGIDSALVALIATDALGPERVSCVAMPSPHSSPETQEDARRIAANLGVDLIEIPIEQAMNAYGDLLSGPFASGESTSRPRTSRRGSGATS
jgi:NAD+ synthetase